MRIIRKIFPPKFCKVNGFSGLGNFYEVGKPPDKSGFRKKWNLEP